MLNLSGTQSTAPPRTPFAVSVALHLGAALALAYASQANAHRPLPLFRPAHTTTLVYVPIVPVEIPAMKLAELQAPKPVTAEEPAPLRPMPEVAPIFESRRAEILAPVELPVEPPPAPTPAPTPAAPRPEVSVGAFANAEAPVRIPEPAKQIEIAGFDRATKQTTEMKAATTAVGGFDRQVTSNIQPQTPQQNAIADAGFNRSTVVMSAAPQGRVIRETGFGNTNSREQPRATQPPAEVMAVSFNQARAPQRTTEAAPPPPQITAVEVLSKPTPIYTQAARNLGIQGDVVLEVEFCANGKVRVLRVVRGLGHGLDEAAMQAARQIRFKPAHDSGQAVDSRATVNIVFRLA